LLPSLRFLIFFITFFYTFRYFHRLSILECLFFYEPSIGRNQTVEISDSFFEEVLIWWDP
jgi:hypothetical protein